MMFLQEEGTNSSLESSGPIRDDGPFTCACVTGARVCARHRTRKPMSLFTYLTTQKRHFPAR